MRILILGSALASAAAGLAGCYTGICAREVTRGDEAGLRYFLPAPYLIIRELPDGRWDATVELMVDRGREFTVQPYTILASSKMVVKFAEDGTLKSFQLDQDATRVPEGVVEALKEIQLKRLEIEQEELEREIDAAEKADRRARESSRWEGDGETTEALASASRRVLIYKIEGDRCLPEARGQSEVELKLPGAGKPGARNKDGSPEAGAADGSGS